MVEAMRYPSSRAAGAMGEDIYDSSVWGEKVINGDVHESDENDERRKCSELVWQCQD